MSPDFGHFDPNISQNTRGLVARYQRVSPTIIWEVGYSQRRRALERRTALGVAASGGNTKLGMAVDLAYHKEPGIERTLEEIYLSLWKVVDYRRPDDATTSECYNLRRADGKSEDDRSLPSKYSFSVNWDKEIVTWVVAGSSEKVSSFCLSSSLHSSSLLLDL